jgi:peptidoglycan/LPS O-acetylase OafA/YrhL
MAKFRLRSAHVSPQSRSSRDQIPSLDGLRCVAILPVFLSHVLQAAGAPNVFPGNFGVTLFFFLSGYLITTLMRLERERTGGVDLRLFYLRRALRIFPTCYAVLLIAGLYGLAVGYADPLWILGQALHLTNYQLIAGGWTAPIAPHTSVYWSLAVEEHFYLLFPLVYLSLASRLDRAALSRLLLALCAGIFAWRCVLIYGLDAPPDRTYVATDTRMDSILFGCVLAIHGNPVLDRTRFRERTWKGVLLPLGTALVLASFAGPRSFRETFGYTLQGLGLFTWFVTAVRYPEWGIMRLLNRPWVKWIGGLSYGIYLTHPSMIALTENLVGQAVVPLMLVSGVLTLVVSAFLFYAIERPLGRIRHRLSVLARGASDGRPS